jgi:hypothetical protein
MCFSLPQLITLVFTGALLIGALLTTLYLWNLRHD